MWGYFMLRKCNVTGLLSALSRVCVAVCRWVDRARAFEVAPRQRDELEEVDVCAEQSVASNPFALACSAIDLPCNSSAV